MLEGHELELALLLLLAASELLAVSPLKSNSLYELGKNVLGALKLAKDDFQDKEEK